MSWLVLHMPPVLSNIRSDTGSSLTEVFGHFHYTVADWFGLSLVFQRGFSWGVTELAQLCCAAILAITHACCFSPGTMPSWGCFKIFAGVFGEGFTPVPVPALLSSSHSDFPNNFAPSWAKTGWHVQSLAYDRHQGKERSLWLPTLSFLTSSKERHEGNAVRSHTPAPQHPLSWSVHSARAGPHSEPMLAFLSRWGVFMDKCKAGVSCSVQSLRF